LRFLTAQQREDGRFSMEYGVSSGRRSEKTSPYFDGETLLALAKAARYAGREDLLPILQKAARRSAEYYTVEAWEKERDSDDTKGFYQWGSMAFREYVEASWPDAGLYSDTALALAWWMEYTHRVLSRSRNSAYAYEGLASTYAVAKARGEVDAAADLARLIDHGLANLTEWQVGGPLADRNAFLRRHPTSDVLAVGGVMNENDDPPLRIDVAQHQMHAVMLAIDTVYAN
jgi:UDP-N-acetylmuramoyl-tripeptide--D-alanyl-D-alanine ligase